MELVLILYCCKDDVTREVRSCTCYLAVVKPTHSNAEGLVECLGQALRRIGQEDIRDREEVVGRSGSVLVGGGTDGASVNIGIHNGMKARSCSQPFPGSTGPGITPTVWSWLARMLSQVPSLPTSTRCFSACTICTGNLPRSPGS